MNLKLYTLNGYDIYRGIIVVDFKDENEGPEGDHRDKIIKSQYEEIVKLKLEINKLRVELQNKMSDDDLEKELELLMK